MTFSAVILAGGKSSRMGRDKAWLEVDGQPLLARQIRLVQELGAAELFISGRVGVDYSKFGCPVLSDDFPDAGPLAGLERALRIAATPLVLALAVDMPEMTAGTMRSILGCCGENTGAIPRIGGVIEPLAAVYPKSALALATDQLQKKSNAARTFAGLCVSNGLANFVELPACEAGHFANWNSPADHAKQGVDAADLR